MPRRQLGVCYSLQHEEWSVLLKCLRLLECVCDALRREQRGSDPAGGVGIEERREEKREERREERGERRG